VILLYFAGLVIFFTSGEPELPRDWSEMIKIDGSLYSGSGTILRYAAALCTLTGEPLHMFRIREKRDRPGLRRQHLQAVQTCAELCGGSLEGGGIGSREIVYRPGKDIRGGDFRVDIGSAGSATMLAFTLIPVALWAPEPSRFNLIGGLFQDFAPSAYHMQKVLLPLLQRMGADISFTITRPGYVPEGNGELIVEVNPAGRGLAPIEMAVQGAMKKVRGISLSSHLQEEKVSERMAREAGDLLARHGIGFDAEILHDRTALQRGAALLLRADTDTECILGSDRVGRRGRRSEAIAGFCVRTLMEDIRSGATVDRHTADQLILFGGLAAGRTEYIIPAATDHVKTNIEMIRKLLGAGAELLPGRRLRIDGIGLHPTGRQGFRVC